jgi:divalent metal cation (Fe/Co/Zn/Cd) transporter
MAGAYKAVKERKGDRPLLQYLRETKDSDLVVIFGEDAAACLGLALALVAVGIAWGTGDATWDAVGTLCIGVVLIAVAVFLAVEVKSLLLGESADPALLAVIQQAASKDPQITGVLRTLAVQQGPGEILVACKLSFRGDISGHQLIEAINAFEVRLQDLRPDVKWCFIEPDTAA